MKELEYPFDSEMILRQRKSLRKQMLNDESNHFIEKRIAVLGGQTTRDVKQILELFLLNYGIKPSFYESEYNKFYEDAMFDNEELKEFCPDLIYICTCIRNVTSFPVLSDDKRVVDEKRKMVIDMFYGLWNHITKTYNCPIIQNNFEYPFYRLMGNKDASDYHGKVNFITTLNCSFYDYAQTHDNFYICDINYLSSSYGLDKWSDPYYWYMYKYGIAVPAIPTLAYNVANIIKSIYGKNKKVLNLDLDNTLWGGIVGDDGAENIEIGQETALSQSYSEFQDYLKQHKQLGVLLTINSKNDEKNAIAGLERPDSILHKDDFVNIKANWKPKSINLVDSANEMSLLPESFVFVDDNPAERAIIEDQVPGAAIPELKEVEHYIQQLDKAGYFEVTSISKDDLNRTEMYQENAKRAELQASFDNYEDYLKSLEMKSEIKEFIPLYFSRITQLTNKSNQFNLTTKRYNQTEIEEVANNENYITLYGKLVDKFGDNGVVSIVIGKINDDNKELHIDLWLMSCRVLKRNMEYAMMDELVSKAKKHNINKLIGYYYPTAKNSMVKDFYGLMGFAKISEDNIGNSIWEYEIDSQYKNKQDVIEIVN